MVRWCDMIKTSAPGKIILFGEHAVVYDKLGIAAAINLRTHCKVEKSKNIIIENLGTLKVVEKDLEEIYLDIEQLVKEKKYLSLVKMLNDDPNVCVKYIIAIIMQECDFSPVKVKTSSQLRKGMGTSASVFASLSKALSDYFNLNLSKKKISELAYRGDVVAHGGTAGGLDNAIVTFGGYIKTRKSTGPETISIDVNLPIVIGDTKKPAMTGVTVPMVRKKVDAGDRKVIAAIDEIDIISESALEAISSGDLVELGKLMDENQEHLRTIDG
mgnify:CR=1 FL=1